MGFIYLPARLARLARLSVDQRTKYKFFWSSVEYIYLAARLARQWIKELGIIVMRAILV